MPAHYEYNTIHKRSAAGLTGSLQKGKLPVRGKSDYGHHSGYGDDHSGYGHSGSSGYGHSGYGHSGYGHSGIFFTLFVLKFRIFTF